ncbi:MAG: hypothetical protein ACTHMS_22145 [Jatrophihabitans sp.]|uniref:hypothetical protein n=1 Tax=Jatrophihabitans sp. TaxID=1932789 RepID=UPI003F7ED3EA
MTTDLMLVSRRPPTMDDLRAAVATTPALGRAEVVGDFADDPFVEVSAEVSGGGLLLQALRPSVSMTTAADPYTVDLGLAPPLDADGHCHLTGMTMSGQAGEDEIRAVMGLVASVAQRCDGFLVANGEYTPLDGVPEPRRVSRIAPVPSQPPPARAFVEAFLTRAADGEAGWRDSTALLRVVLDGLADLRPQLIEIDGEWRPFLPGDPVPAWWPDPQRLLTPDPYVTWRLAPAAGPAQRYTQLSAEGDLDPDAAERFVGRLVELAGADLDYGLVHAWHPDEQHGPIGLRVGAAGPWMLFNDRDPAQYLPTLWWAQVFGPPWVELFGRDVLAATPAHRVEEVAPGHWLVQLTEHLADVVDDHERFAAVRAKAIEHLGADAFFDPAVGSRGTYRAASIPTLRERGLA